MGEKKKFYVGVKAVFMKDGRVLMLRNVREKWQGRVYWDLPGGRIHTDETMEQTLKRTVAKEIGVRNFLIGDLVNPYLFKTNIEDRIGYVVIIYTCVMKNGKITLSEDHDRYEWFTKHEIEKLETGEECYKKAALTVLENL